MKSFPIVILGGGVVAGYAAKEFVEQSGKKRDLAIVTHNSSLKEDPTMKAKKQAGTTPANLVDGLLTVADDT
ncbi:MAG: hypothetical protein LV481_09465 [Methylacidiphilales bacterium]|nr:hypothetical protein [Candidatus Methylacidiphilales bacterium]